MAGDELIERDGGPAAPGAIEAAEQALGTELPEDYRAFMAEHELPKRRDEMRDRVPAELLPIADAGGDLIVLGTGGDARGHVYQWEHEFEAEDPPPHWDNLTELAPSFREWFSALVPLTDDDLPPFVVESASIKRGFLRRMRRQGRL
jgi:hypothetical protein